MNVMTYGLKVTCGFDGRMEDAPPRTLILNKRERLMFEEPNVQKISVDLKKSQREVII